MQNKLLLLLSLAFTLAVRAEIPDMAVVSRLDTTASDTVSLTVVALDRIQLTVNDQYQVRSVFLFTDGSSMFFDNVDAISFFRSTAPGGEDNPPTAVQNPSDVELAVYPNPATEVLYISGMPADSKGRVINANGQPVMDFNGLTTSIDVSAWAQGTYLICIDNRIFKLIKQ